MTRHHVEHVSEFRYGAAVHGNLMLLRLHPSEDFGQRVLSFRLDVRPAAHWVACGDAFGNRCHLLSIHSRHRHATVRASSEVETATLPALPDRIGAAAWNALSDPHMPLRHWEFLAHGGLARPSPALDAFVEQNDIRRGEDPLSSLLALSSRLHDVLRYEPGSTAVDSPIERILATGRGVCQDYAHVMIAIGRTWGIPSRYVSGYLNPGAATGEQPSPAASHAWAEFLMPELGWVGLDPTHGAAAGPGHIRTAVGRDYNDAAPTRGTVFGGGESRLGVNVTVTESGPGARETKPGARQRESAETTQAAPAPGPPREETGLDTQ